MEKVYFTYRHRKDRNWNIYTPSYEWGDSYPEWEWKATIVDNKINTTNWKHLGWIEVDTTALSLLDVENELKNYWKYGWLIYITNDEAVLYMQNLTDYTETTPRTFELSPENIEVWFESPATYLTII